MKGDKWWYFFSVIIKRIETQEKYPTIRWGKPLQKKGDKMKSKIYQEMYDIELVMTILVQTDCKEKER